MLVKGGTVSTKKGLLGKGGSVSKRREMTVCIDDDNSEYEISTNLHTKRRELTG